MKIQEKLLTPNPYSRPQTKLVKVTKIVVHWVGNAGSTAMSNRNYFEGLKTGKNGTYASSHYIIGLEGEVIRCIPDTEIAYHAKEANTYSIGIENCHPNWEGEFNDKTYQTLITLCASLSKRYGLNPLTDLLRHYDITKKICPKYYVEHQEAWEQLKKDVASKMNTNQEIRLTTIQLNGVMKEISSILKDGNNYIELRDLEDAYIKIDYDGERKIPIIKVMS